MRNGVDIAWAAGLIEGEGTFGVMRKGHLTYAYVSACGVDRDVIEKLHRILSVGAIRTEHRPGCQPLHIWRTYSRAGFAHVADLLRPHLGKRRTQRLNEVESQTTRERRLPGSHTHCKRGHPLTPDNRVRQGRTRTGAVQYRCRTCKLDRERARRTS